MSCKWPNFTAATAFEIQPPAIFFARGAEVGRWVSGFGFCAIQGRKIDGSAARLRLDQPKQEVRKVRKVRVCLVFH